MKSPSPSCPMATLLQGVCIVWRAPVLHAQMATLLQGVCIVWRAPVLHAQWLHFKGCVLYEEPQSFMPNGYTSLTSAAPHVAYLQRRRFQTVERIPAISSNDEQIVLFHQCTQIQAEDRDGCFQGKARKLVHFHCDYGRFERLLHKRLLRKLVHFHFDCGPSERLLHKFLEHAGSQAKSRHLPSGELELGQVGNALSEKLSWLGQ
jgi:hypothetical protein